MKADKKKAKAEAKEGRPKSKNGDKAKDNRKASEDGSSGKKKAKKNSDGSFDSDEVKLLPSPEPKAKASGKARLEVRGNTRAKPAAKAALSSARAGGAQEGSSRGSSSRATAKVASGTSGAASATSAKATKAGGTAQNAQRKVSATQGASKTSARAASGAAQGSRVAPKSTSARAQGQTQRRAATGEIEDDEARAQPQLRSDRTRLRVKSTSAAKARQEYAESDEEDEWEEDDDDWQEDEEGSDDEEAEEAGEVKERGLVQFRRARDDAPDKAEPKVKKSTLIIGAACLALLLVGFCMMNFAPKKGGFPGGPGFGGEATEVTVRSTTAQVATLHDYVETNGEIECESSVECYPDIGGKIAKVFVALGDRVWKGTALAEVDPNEPGTYFINSVVYAPISGMVTATPKEVGTTVTTTTSITTIGNVTRLQIRAKVPERYVAFLKVGLKANIILEAYPEETFTATVTKVSPVVDSDSRTKEILLRFDQSDPRINAGMFAKLTLFTADYEGEIVVPSNTIVEKTGGKQNVFVLAPGGGSVSLREVETGKSVDTMIQILSGLNEGERVITEGMTSLSDGAPVRDITVGLGQSALFAESASAFQAGSEPQGGSAAGGPPPNGAPRGARGAAR